MDPSSSVTERRNQLPPLRKLAWGWQVDSRPANPFLAGWYSKAAGECVGLDHAVSPNRGKVMRVQLPQY